MANRLFLTLAGTGLAVVAVGVIASCYSATCADTQTCAFTGGGDGASTDGEVILPAECRPRPEETSAVIVPTCGIFVATDGNDENPGTPAAPVRTLAKGLTVAKQMQRRVYVCGGTYNEAVAMDASLDGLQIYGAIDCATQSYDRAQRAIVKPASGIALKVTGVTAGVTFEDITFEAVDATTPGESSIAAFVSVADNVALRRVVLGAGAGAAGAPGAAAVEPVSKADTPPVDSRAGNNAVANTGGIQRECTCFLGATQVGVTRGGGGGNQSGTTSVRVGDPGEPASADAGAGGNGGLCNTQGAGGGGGADGVNGVAGPAPAATGYLTASAWTTHVSSPGGNGTLAQGGGGGSGAQGLGSGGGGGGACGGCPGGGGGSGQAGGASFALLVYKSALSVIDGSMASSSGANGGDGAAGADGQSGGQPGAASGSGCSAGTGGKGGKGGGGAGGAGGLSVAVGYVGNEPLVDDATKARLVAGAAGSGGAGGEPGNAGPPGTAAPVTVLQEGP